jgi:hypothetical protein
MKNGLALIHKIWSELKEKECCTRVVNVERRKWRNGNKIGMRSSWMKLREEKEKGEKKRGEKEKNEMS